MANAVPLAVRLLRQAAQASHRAGSAPGLLQAGEGGRPVRACGGHVAQRSRVRAGIRAQSISRGLSRQRPGQPGRRALKRGRWISQLRAHARPPPVGWGRHPANSGPRARCATQIPLVQKAQPARGPPDFPPVARKCLHLGVTYRRSKGLSSTHRRFGARERSLLLNVRNDLPIEPDPLRRHPRPPSLGSIP